jgi:hypothetical protein
MSDALPQPKSVNLRTQLRLELMDSIDQNERKVELLEKQITKDKELLHAINGSLGAITAQATGYGAVSESVNVAVESLKTNQFTASDVESSFKELFPLAPLNKTAVRTTLWNMVKKNKLRCTRKGTNRVPAEYERVVSVIGDAANARVRRRPSLVVISPPSNGDFEHR